MNLNQPLTLAELDALWHNTRGTLSWKSLGDITVYVLALQFHAPIRARIKDITFEEMRQITMIHEDTLRAAMEVASQEGSLRAISDNCRTFSFMNWGANCSHNWVDFIRLNTIVTGQSTHISQAVRSLYSWLFLSYHSRPFYRTLFCSSTDSLGPRISRALPSSTEGVNI